MADETELFESDAVRRMKSGEVYDPYAKELVELRLRARAKLAEVNRAESGADAMRALKGLLGEFDAESSYIEPPFRCDYGRLIKLGRAVYMNFDCVLLDCNEISVGDECKFGPGVHIYTVNHPLEPELRRGRGELTKPVRIGRNVWIGGRAVILPGVSIGDDAVVAAAAVVSRDVPSGCLVAGNPARIVRELAHKVPAHRD
mmetsp:Transcript_3089/g.8589  ORF Transcript_3089/g.8589 Transcript_3089/m.8589 type:complete len:201 (+) Transcript_3089:1291-1893(+)